MVMSSSAREDIAGFYQCSLIAHNCPTLNPEAPPMAMHFLQGIRILDLSQFLPGPFATQMLADMGADVVKVEPPKGDPMRGLDPITNERATGPYHALVNAGKRVIAIDLKDTIGREQFVRLIEQTDVLMESYRPGVMAKLGFDHAAFREINPRLVHCALSGYGQNGPMGLAAGHDINYAAAAGQLGLTGSEARPHMAYPMVADYAGALQSTIAILGALVGRGQTGQGGYLDVAMADAVLAWQSQALTALKRGETPGRGHNLLTGGAAFYGVYETKDARFVSLGAIETVFWENFCRAIAREDLVSRQSEPLPQTALTEDLAAIFKTKTRDAWDAALADVDCCYHPVLDIDELAQHPQNQARAMIRPQAGLEDEGGMAVLSAMWVDGSAPGARAAMIETDVETILQDWTS
jgi:alpha-methylacyl-CoA racemase